MNCKDIEHLFNKHIDNEADVQDISRIETHIARCPGCKEKLNGMKKIKAIIQGVPRYNASPALAQKIATAIAKQQLINPWQIALDIFKIWTPISLSLSIIFTAALIRTQPYQHQPQKTESRMEDVILETSMPIHERENITFNLFIYQLPGGAGYK